MLPLIVLPHEWTPKQYQERVLVRAFPDKNTYFIADEAEDVLEKAKEYGGVELIICDKTWLGRLSYLVETVETAAFLRDAPVVAAAMRADYSLKMLKDKYHHGSLNVVDILDLDDRMKHEKYEHLLQAVRSAEPDEKGHITANAFKKALAAFAPTKPGSYGNGSSRLGTLKR